MTNRNKQVNRKKEKRLGRDPDYRMHLMQMSGLLYRRIQKQNAVGF